MRAPIARRELAVVVAAQALLLLVLAPRYGPHRDELYFAAAGRHLAWGYPDQPSLTPLFAAGSQAVAGQDLVVLRLWSVLGVAATTTVATLLARLLGAQRSGQTLAAVLTAFSAVEMSVGHRLNTETFDVLAWGAVLLVVGHALADERPRLWLLAGLVAGIGLNDKHDIVVCLLSVALAVLVHRPARAALRTPYPWLGGLLALLLWLPNLVWEAQHGWPVFALSADIADEYGGVGGRVGLVAQALLIYSPLMAVVWIAGLVALLRRSDALRVLGLALVVTTAFFLVTGGKGYYLTGAILPALAAGCTGLARRWAGRRLIAAAVVLVLSSAVAWPALVPVLPLRAYAGSFYPALDSDQPETVGWPAYVATVRHALDSLPAGRRRTAVVYAANYGEAGALLWYHLDAPVYGGQNGFGAWGPPPDGPGRTKPVVVVGWSHLGDDFTGCRRAGVVRTGMDNDEDGTTVDICAGPRGSWARVWPDLTFYAA